MQKGLIVAGLELFGTDKKPIWVLPEPLGDGAAWETVERCFSDLPPGEFVFTGERDDRLPRAPALLQVVADGVEILNGSFDTAGDNHRSGLATDLLLSSDMLAEVVHHDLGLF